MKMKRRGLETLIRFSKNSYYNYHCSYSATNTRYISSKQFRINPWTTEKPKSIYYQVEDKGKRGADSDTTMLVTNYTKKAKEVEKELTRLKKGDFVNLSDLLFTKNRDYLIKCDCSQQVKADHLVGKVVVIFFNSVLELDMDDLTSLMKTYKYLQHNNGFEVVYVEVNDSSSSETSDFGDIISRMPWTAIPLSDITSREHLKRIFGIPDIVCMGIPVIVDSTGMILQCRDYIIFDKYGALGYPFSDERINYLNSEDEAASRQPSLTKLLASPERDYLISNKGDKVPIHTLEDKVVALYFYEEGFTNKKITQELKIAYEELAKSNKMFEVVLIYLFDAPRIQNFEIDEAFQKAFKTMPWLALPYEDSLLKKLKRIFVSPWDFDGKEFALVIIGPHGKFVEPFGVFILQNFKSPAYPFSLEKVAKLVTEEAKELKLEMLWDPKSVFGGKYGSQGVGYRLFEFDDPNASDSEFTCVSANEHNFKVRFSHLAGKNVIFIFDWGQLKAWELEFLETLKERYIRMKGTEDEFEVIHITQLSSKTEHVASLPWFVQPRGQDYNSCVSVLFGLYLDSDNYLGNISLIAFDRAGTLVRKTVYPVLKDMDFPFSAGAMEKETLSALVTLYQWNRLQHPRTIYKYNKSYDLSI